MRKRGEGCVFQRSDSRFWWIKYQDHGKPVRQPTEFLVDCGNAKRNATAHRNAESLLKQKLAEIKTGTYTPPSVERVKVSELADAWFRDYRINNRKSVRHTTYRWNHLGPVFGHLRGADVTSDHIRRYVDQRQSEGATNATINRELAALKRMFTLGVENDKVLRMPRFPKLAESAPRTGFINAKQYESLAGQCTEVWLRTMLALAYTFGFREGELLTMKIGQVDLLNRSLRLDPGTTKNGQGRTAKLTSDTLHLLTECVRDKEANAPLFTHKDGTAVRDFRKAWWKLCIGAGLGKFICHSCEASAAKRSDKCSECGSSRLSYSGLLFHDLRRSAVRNMVRRGISEKVAMRISGHKTRSVFDRYNIVDEADLDAAAQKIEQGHRDEWSRFGHVSENEEVGGHAQSQLN